MWHRRPYSGHVHRGEKSAQLWNVSRKIKRLIQSPRTPTLAATEPGEINDSSEATVVPPDELPYSLILANICVLALENVFQGKIDHSFVWRRILTDHDHEKGV